MENHKFSLELHSGWDSALSMLVLCLSGYVSITIATILASWLNLSWLQLVVAIVWWLVFACEVFLFPLGTRIRVKANAVSVHIFGIPVRSMPLSKIKGIYLTYGYRDQGLCLCTQSLSEAAACREKVLLRQAYYRSGLAYRKTRPDWEKTFAQEHFSKLRRKFFLILRHREGIWIEPDLSIIPVLQQILPEAQLHDLRPTYHHVQRGEDNARVLCYGLEPREHMVQFLPDGILVVQKKNQKPVYSIPGDHICTIIRTEHYSTSRNMPTRMKYIAISTRTVEDLTSEELIRGGSRASQWLQFPEGHKILAIRSCRMMLHSWSCYERGFCAFADTPEHVEILRSICPNARWVEG